MRIVDEKMKKSKAEQYREIIPQICDKDKAVQFDRPCEVANFCIIADKMGYETRSRKTDGNGWNVWVRTPDPNIQPQPVIPYLPSDLKKTKKKSRKTK